MTFERKQAILEAYKDRERKAHDIANEFGISSAQLTKIVIEMGGQPRRPNAMGKRGTKTVKRCPNCHTKIEIKGARFCFNCGHDIRDEKTLLIERLQKVMSKNILIITEANRDEFQHAIIDAIKYLEKA